MATKAPSAQQYKINIDEAMFNPAFFPYLHYIFNYEVYWGGRGSGKSVFISEKLILQLSLTEGRNLIVMRKQATDCRNSCFAEMYNVIYEFHLEHMWDIRENPDMRMYNKVTKSEIIFTGMDKAENVKSLKFKHGNATDLWYEELTEEMIEQNITILDESIRSPYYKTRMIVSFNPCISTFWINKWMKTYCNDDGIPTTKVTSIKTEIRGRTITSDCLIHHSTYKDNKWNFVMDKDGNADYDQPLEYAAKLERLKFVDPYRYRVSCLGLWGTSGESVFNANKISERLKILEEQYLVNPPQQINFSYETDSKGLPIVETLKPSLSSIGETLIFIEPNPKHPYVASIDPANEGNDYYAVQIMDNVTDEQAAVYHSQKLGADCMLQVYGLLMMYNEPLVAPETNMGEYAMAKLKEWGYTNIYQRESPKDDYHETVEPKLGFRTTSGNRQAIIDNAIEWCKTNLDKISDIETLNEMITFTRQNIKNKGIFMGAEAGAHDDLVISLAILLKAKEQQSCEEQSELKHIEGYWTMGELNLAVKEGRIDEDTMREYVDNNRRRFDKQKNNNRRKSRYAR